MYIVYFFFLKIKNNISLKDISIHLVFSSFIFPFFIVIVQDLEINPTNFISARFPHKVEPPPPPPPHPPTKIKKFLPFKY